MKLLPQTAVKATLKILSFLITRGIIKEDQAFTFFSGLPISDTIIKDLLPGDLKLVAQPLRSTHQKRANYFDRYDR